MGYNGVKAKVGKILGFLGLGNSNVEKIMEHSDERSSVYLIGGNAAEAQLGFGSLSSLTETHTLAVFGTLGGEILI